MNRFKIFNAFSLAEVLVTLGVIAVVAVMVIPGVMAKYTERVKASRIQNIHQKISQAMDKMLVIRGINDYPSTRAFVEELKNHLSIVQVCENDNLEACWPTQKVLLNDEGEEWEISKTTKARTLKMPKKDGYNDWDDTIGITTTDGLQMILSYNKRCAIDPNRSPIWSSDISTTTSCIAGIFDWNGGKRPNKLGDDVRAFNANGLGSSCAIELGDERCFTAPFVATPITKAVCEAQKEKLGIKECPTDSDYWAGAVLRCGGVQNMPTMDELSKLASEIYQGNPELSAYGNIYNLVYIPGTATNLGLLEPTFHLWSKEERTNGRAYRRHYGTTYSSGHNCDVPRSFSGYEAICVGE